MTTIRFKVLGAISGGGTICDIVNWSSNITTPPMKIFAVAVSCCIFSLSGCGPSVRFENPLVDPAQARNYPELHGVYPFSDDAAENEEFLYIGPAGKEFPPGFMRFVSLVANSETGRVELSEYAQLAFCQKIGENYWVHLPVLDDKAAELGGRSHINKWPPSKPCTYELFKWQPRGDGTGYDWYFLDTKYFASEVAAGHLRGLVEYKDAVDDEVPELQSVNITASTPELWKYFEFVDRKGIKGLADDASTHIAKWPNTPDKDDH